MIEMLPCKSCREPHPRRMPCSVWVEIQKSKAAEHAQITSQLTLSEKMKESWRQRKAKEAREAARAEP